jgi:hypothetical protein
LSLISPKGQHAAIYAHVQGNLGALLLSADRPTEAITEFEGALKLGQQLQQQLQQQIKQHRKNKKKYKQQQQQHASAALAELQQELTDVQQQLAGATFNLGKALTSIGRCDQSGFFGTVWCQQVDCEGALCCPCSWGWASSPCVHAAFSAAGRHARAEGSSYLHLMPAAGLHGGMMLESPSSLVDYDQVESAVLFLDTHPKLN